LKSDWSKETLDDVLSLLWKMIAGAATPSTFEWQKVLEFNTGRVSSKGLNQQIINVIQQFSKIINREPIPEMPSSFSDTKGTRSVAQAEKTWAYLVLQAMARLTGDTDLFQDTQSLLFLCAIHYLLPQLKSQRLLAEHDCLLNALYMHTILVWREQPSHEFYLQSLIMDYLEEGGKRLELLQASLRLTPVEDHSFLTKVQALWSDLLDRGDYKSAEELLLYVYRYSPQSSLDEIKEMFYDTQRSMTANRD